MICRYQLGIEESAEMEADTVNSRPYRSKLKRPCDRCRSRKIACILPETGPCRNCSNVGKACTFEKPPNPRSRFVASRLRTARMADHPILGTAARQNEGIGAGPYGLLAAAEHLSFPGRGGNNTADGGNISPYEKNTSSRRMKDSDIHFLPTMTENEVETGHDYGSASSLDPANSFRDKPIVQHIRSLDQLDGSTVQLFGTSAESDPWLLRHCKYDDNGMRNLHGIHFRNVGGVPVEGLVPVQFLVTEDSLLAPSKKATAISPELDIQKIRHELNKLIPSNYGIRLIALFMRFVFPLLPIISRTQMGIGSTLSEQTLQNVPTHLLAALYASALPFKAHDPELVLCGVYDDSLCDRLWRIVYELISQEIHTPHLSVLQASLLYLQRLPTGSQSALADSPFLWSFLGSTVALASSLGLHLEPQPWGIPAWEKRLRRRLWWAVYLEDKWRSLLMGRPAFITSEEWDVQDLTDSDFILNRPSDEHIQSPGADEHGAIFKSFTKLVRIAERIHETFYTLKSSQRMSEDFRASIDAARPIREELQAWYVSLPDYLRIRQRLQMGHQESTPRIEGVSSLHFAYLILELFVYRAILRPLARSPPPPPIADEKNPQSIMWLLEDLGLDGQELDQLPAVDFSELGDAAEATLNAAEKCAGIIVNFVGALTPPDFDTFWYSWTRISFATVSNFVLLLLIQAPTAQHASRTKHFLNIWLQNLGRQHRHHETLMALGLVRLRTLITDGLPRNFIVSAHLADVLNMDSGGEPSSSNNTS